MQRGNVSIDNLTLLNAILYVAVNGCTWRGLPAEYGRWHTVYTRMSRWAKAGILGRVFEELQLLQLLKVRLKVVSLNSTSIKVHLDRTGAQKKGALRASAAPVAGGTPRFIWLPRVSSRSSASA